MTFGSLFAGIGGMDLGLERAGMTCSWQVEINPFCREVLARHWPDVRRHDDVRTFPPTNREEWRVDLICGGFPCQDISYAGKGAGIDGERSGLWTEYLRVIRLLRPRHVIVENVPAILARGLGRVLGNLAEIGYDAEWDCVSACSMGAPHTRDRVFIIAYSDEIRRRGYRFCIQCEHEVQDKYHHWQNPSFDAGWADVEHWFSSFVPPENESKDATRSGGMGHGVSDRLDRIGALGNAVVPQVAEWIGRRVIETASDN